MHAGVVRSQNKKADLSQAAKEYKVDLMTQLGLAPTGTTTGAKTRS
jgi:hypothetical protein